MIRNTTSLGKWTKEAAEATGAGFIDVNEITAAKFDKIAYEEGLRIVNEYFKNDHTHTSYKGAILNANSIAEGLRCINSPLKDYLK